MVHIHLTKCTFTDIMFESGAIVVSIFVKYGDSASFSFSCFSHVRPSCDRSEVNGTDEEPKQSGKACLVVVLSCRLMLTASLRSV